MPTPMDYRLDAVNPVESMMRGMGQGLEMRAAQQTYAQNEVMNPLDAQAAQQGLAMGQQSMDINAAQEARAAELQPFQIQQMQTQQAEAQRAAAREQEFHAALGRLAALGDGVTAADYARVSRQFPEFGESLRQTFDMTDQAASAAQLRLYGQAYAAIQSGNVPIARQMVEQQLTAAQNGGDPEDIAVAQGMLQLLDQSPEAAATALGMALTTLGGSEFTDLLGGPGPTDEELADIERKTRAEYINQTGNFTTTQDAYRRVQASTDTAAGDLSLIFSFMKMLDPGSVVRETEFSNAQSAGAWLEQAEGEGISVPRPIAQAIRSIQTGQRLGTAQSADFRAQAEALMRAAQTREQEVRAGLMPTIERFGMDPNRIFYTDAVEPAPVTAPAMIANPGASGPIMTPAMVPPPVPAPQAPVALPSYLRGG